MSLRRGANQYDAFLLSRSEQACAVLALENLAARCHWKFVIFGGAARDIIMNGADAAPRDLDIVVAGVSVADLQAELGFKDKTAFDGLKGKIGNIDVDIWPLESTWAFSRMNLGRPPTFEDLVHTTPFNLEAVAIEPNITTVVYDGGFQKCIADKRLELSYEVNASAFVALTLVRAAIFSKRFDLSFGPRLSAFIGKHFAKKAKMLTDMQMKYYGREMMSLAEMTAILSPASAA